MNNITITYADQKPIELNIGGPKGDKGDQGIQGIQGYTGAVPNISVGTVTTLPAGESAAVTRQAASPDESPVFDFGIPKGDPGEVTQADLNAYKQTVNTQFIDITQQIALIPRIVVSETEPVDPTEGMIWFRPIIEIPVTDYLFRFDASQLDLTDNAKVATWADLSENSNDLVQAVGANQPTYLATGFNGKPSVQFSRDQWLTKTQFALTNRNALTFFAVIKLDDDALGSSMSIFNIGLSSDTDTNARQYLLKLSSSSVYQVRIGGSIKGSVVASETPEIVAGRFDKITNKLYLLNGDGTTDEASATSSIRDTHDTLQIGKGLSTTSPEPFGGKISELIYFQRALTELEISRMGAYLKGKWGIV